MTKRCRDCLWMTDPGEFARCLAPQNLVRWRENDRTGFPAERQVYNYTYCATHRMGPPVLDWVTPVCGYFPRWWRPKFVPPVYAGPLPPKPQRPPQPDRYETSRAIVRNRF